MDCKQTSELGYCDRAGIRDCSAAVEEWGQSASCQQRRTIARGMGDKKCQIARNIYRGRRAGPDRSRVAFWGGLPKTGYVECFGIFAKRRAI